MLRGFRHTLFLLLQVGISVSGIIAVVLYPDSWKSVLICVAGATAASLLCERVAARYLRRTLGRLRRLADRLGHGRPAAPLEAHPGDDFYKLVSAINMVSARLAKAAAEEKRLNQQLRRTEKLAVIGELAASVAHEINNPLDGIQNCARIARRSIEDRERLEQMLDLMDGGLKRIELIVRRLLTLARQHVTRPERADLCELIDATLGPLADDLRRRGVRVRREHPAGPMPVSVDPPLLQQAFANLVYNAADAMPEGGELLIRVRRESEEDGSPIRIEFCDDGVGIPPENLGKVFEPFFTTKGGEKGTGLGLSIAARIVDAHHGAISVAPRSPRGVTFTVRLPALGAEPATARSSAASASRCNP
jgi:signal transduction histidine kinase